MPHRENTLQHYLSVASNHMWFLAIVPDPWAINFGEFKDDFPGIAYSNLSGSAAALFAMHAATNAVNRVQG